MPDEAPKPFEPGSGGMLGALGLSTKALLLVAILALLVWWYYQTQGMTLSTSETAVVVLGLALLVVAVQAVWAALRRLRAAGKTQRPPE